jgi:RHS repeat-associated protein
VENKVGTTTVSRFTYTNNALGQRTARSQSGSAFTAPATEDFGYNAKGEVTGSSHSVDALRNTLYAYDGIGNRNEATFGGTSTAYTANALNQYSDLTPSNLPTFTPTYEFDGNMVSDGAGKRLVWDGQNRLIEVRNAANDLMATYTYDGQSRRVKKVTTSLAPQGATEEVYLYDGWNRVAMYSIQNSTFSIQNSHTWGRDLSGTFEGAGGVGGLLGVKVGATSYRVSYDANGNVSELIDSAGTIAAHYEYDSFGNVVVANGSYAAANPWRFSTKPVDLETGYSYYGYRFYNPVVGRWINRDPIGEEGGMNLYGFAGNDSVNKVDPLGHLVEWSFISLDNATYQWRKRNGEDVRISFDLVDTSKVEAVEFPKIKELFRVNVARSSRRGGGRCEKETKDINDARMSFAPKGTGDAQTVLGDITLKLDGTLEIDECCNWKFNGTLKSFDDEYDFDIKPFTRNPIRNIGTALGRLYNGSGVKYNIQIRGQKQLNQKGNLYD